MENAGADWKDGMPEVGLGMLEETARRAGEVLGCCVEPAAFSSPSQRTWAFGHLLDEADGEGPSSQAACDLARGIMRSFGPEEGVWAFVGPSGELRGVADIHLCDDGESPCGLAWDYRVALAEGDAWLQIDDGGLFWGYASACDVAELAVLGDYFPSETRCAGTVAVLADLEGVLETTPSRVSRALPEDRRPDARSGFESSLAAACGAVSPSPQATRSRAM